MKFLIDSFKKNKYVLIICIILAVIPFFWIKPGELALGGDSSRLYLYDPLSYLKADSLYIVAPNGLGATGSDQSTLPFFLVLEIIYLIFHSPYILICLLYSLSLVGAFLFTYLIIAEILKKYNEDNNSFLIQLASILGGLFYSLSPSIGVNMQAALIIQNQVFLNPMIFYLILRFLTTQRWKYLWFMLLATLIFAPNFTLAVPALFAFYPLAFIFLGLYVRFCLNKPLPRKKLLIGLLFFLGLQSFHLIPVVVSIFDPGSAYNERLFNAASIQNDGLRYFNALLPLGMVIRSFFYSYSIQQLQWATFVAPLSIILGVFFVKKEQKDFFLIAVFFLITTFLESGNITQIGVSFYRLLFHIPGFSMFRNFFGQWQWVQDFYYSLLIGYSIFLIFSKLKKRIVYITAICFGLLIILVDLPFLDGQIIKPAHRTTNNVSIVFVMDQNYKKTLDFIRSIPIDGKIFDFPFTDFSYQVIPGLNRGAYVGPSPTALLTGKRDFSGEQILSPFEGTFFKLITDKDYSSINKLFGILNVRYILYISDPKAYKEFFPDFPYTSFLKVLPDSSALSDFVSEIKEGTVFQKGYYSLYTSDSTYYLPHFYVPVGISVYNNNDPIENTSFFTNSTENDPRIGYIDKNTCARLAAINCLGKTNFAAVPTISFKKINLTKYIVDVSNAKKPFFLVFSDKFHGSWKVFIKNGNNKMRIQKSYFKGEINEGINENIFFNSKTFETINMKSIPEKQHVVINGYANAWYITPQNINGEDHYELIVEMTQERFVYYGIAISSVSLMIFILFGIRMLFKNK